MIGLREERDGSIIERDGSICGETRDGKNWKPRTDQGFEASVGDHIEEVQRRYAFNSSDYLLQTEEGISFFLFENCF